MLPASLQIPAFRRLVAASTLTITGSLMTFVVLPVVAWEATGSASTFAFILAAGSFGMLVAMPFGGVIADRFDRRRTMLVGNASQMAIMVAMFALVTTEAWWALPAIEFVATTVGSLCASAGPALRRDALTDDVRTQGSAIFSAGTSSANLLGPLLGGAIYAFAGFGAVIALDVVCCACAYVLIRGIRMRTTPPGSVDRTTGWRDAAGRTAGDLRAGFEVATGDPFLRRSLGAGMVGGIANGIVLVSIVPWFDVTLGLPATWWGIAMATMGGAGVVGALTVARLGERASSERLLSLGSLTFAAGSAMLVMEPTTIRLVAAFACIGATNAALSVAVTTATHRRVASSHQGRISSLYTCSYQLTQVVGTLSAGAALEVLQPGTTVHVAIAIYVVAAGCYWRSSRGLRVAPTAFTDEELALSA